MSLPTDVELLRLSDSVRASYTLFERDHKSLVCSIVTWLILLFSEFVIN